MTPRLDQISDSLFTFRNTRKVTTKGSLCVPLHITRLAIEWMSAGENLPIPRSQLLTEGEGQVKGLGRDRIQAILNDYGIIRVLAEEGGRTSRGSVGLAQAYADALKQLADQKLLGDIRGEIQMSLEHIERWWIQPDV